MDPAKTNSCGWQENGAQGKKLRRGDGADPFLFSTCITESFQPVPAWCLSFYFFLSGFLCNQHLVGGGGEGSEAAVAMQKYGLMLKHGVCQTELAFPVVLGALGVFVGGLCPTHRINGSRWCPGAVLEWMGFLRHG